jgi:hypothetical protein
MGSVVRSRWNADATCVARVRVLDARRAPEGVDVDRVRFRGRGRHSLDPALGHLLTPVRGEGVLVLDDERLRFAPGLHAFLPRGSRAAIDGQGDLELVHVQSTTVGGSRPLLRHEAFVAACAVGDRAFRWVLTPQYLSRRIFLHHDDALQSRAGHPLSWFRTTMFDVDGLAPNGDGEPAFKMAYHSRTEFNVCYDVVGEARVRMATHPYAEGGWGPWQALDADTTYCLDEIADDTAEWEATPNGPALRRNQHEVVVRGGHVSLLCAFDPAPIGIERHTPGAYSDYEPVDRLEDHEAHRALLAASPELDAMVDTLSWAWARDALDRAVGSRAWATFLEGRAAQRANERALVDEVRRATPSRAGLVASYALASGEAALRVRPSESPHAR